MHTYAEWIRGEIGRREEEIEGEEVGLKQAHQEAICEEERHLFYLSKIKKYKESIMGPSIQVPSAAVSKLPSAHRPQTSSLELSEEELLYFYDPSKEVGRYRERKEEEVKRRLGSS